MTSAAVGSNNRNRAPLRAAGPHHQAKIVGGDLHQVALLDVLPAAQPSVTHAAPVEVVLEAALDFLGPQFECRRAQAGPIAVYRAPGFEVAVPVAAVSRRLD